MSFKDLEVTILPKDRPFKERQRWHSRHQELQRSHDQEDWAASGHVERAKAQLLVGKQVLEDERDVKNGSTPEDPGSQLATRRGKVNIRDNAARVQEKGKFTSHGSWRCMAAKHDETDSCTSRNTKSRNTKSNGRHEWSEKDIRKIWKTNHEPAE